jgi:outer membrane protein insertion porin family
MPLRNESPIRLPMRSFCLALSWCLLLVAPTLAQEADNPFVEPVRVRVLGVSVEGAESDYTRTFVRQTSGLAEGQELTVPGDPAIGDAIRSIYRLGMFSDVEVLEDRRVGDGVFIAIRVQEEPKLGEYSFDGIKKKHAKELRKKVPLIRRSPVRPEAIENAELIIKEFFVEKGHPLVKTTVSRVEKEDNTVDLQFEIDRGPKVKVQDIQVHGNEYFSDRRVRKKMDTKSDSRWRFWRGAKFDRKKFEEDQQKVLDFYRERGFYDARIVTDSVYMTNVDSDPGLVVAITVEEGNPYFIRDIKWEGNTVYRDEQLEAALGLSAGNRFNGKSLEANLFGNKRSSDVSSLYMNQGYMRFNVNPVVRAVGSDSLDLVMEITEGDIYNFGNIDISGNTKTKEHVVRRELLTIPGQRFSRDMIQESVRRLLQLNYFTQESLAPGPRVEIDDAKKEVDLAYSLDETGSDQLELSGTWGRFGLVLQLRFTFNNFSAQNFFNGKAWRPLPAGDGQKLSVGVQTNGSYYQQYSLSFTEPWFKGRPRQTGVALSYSKIGRNPIISSSVSTGRLQTVSARTFYEQRLSWPDDKFSVSTSVGYQYFNNDNWISTLQAGVSNEVTFRQALIRNSTNHPIFPTAGSRMLFSFELAPPIGDLVQYHKWRFQTGWNVPIGNKLTLGISTDYGFIGSLTGDEVEFERFVVGGSPFETSGFSGTFFGKDVIYMRGYPISAIGPRRSGDPVGGRILNKYTSELRWLAVQSPQLSAAPYLFADAANTWNGFSTYNPASLFRSAGFGVRLFLPILGMVELAYGYNFDEFVPLSSSDDGDRGWSFQFTLGQGFN